MKHIYKYSSPFGGVALRFFFFYVYIYRGGGFFRIFGYGLLIENRRVIPPLFSERYGYKKPFKIKNWVIKPLKP